MHQLCLLLFVFFCCFLTVTPDVSVNLWEGQLTEAHRLDGDSDTSPKPVWLVRPTPPVSDEDGQAPSHPRARGLSCRDRAISVGAPDRCTHWTRRSQSPVERHEGRKHWQPGAKLTVTNNTGLPPLAPTPSEWLRNSPSHAQTVPLAPPSSFYSPTCAVQVGCSFNNN